ncbi:MAG TPA: hypothetical protein VHB21_11245 [Minicystis sp.]|nr:hypothetical protein [Minicystis sp.]
MRSAGIVLLGLVMLVGGVLLGLWKLGVLARVDPVWIAVGVLVTFGLGIVGSFSRRPPTILP